MAKEKTPQIESGEFRVTAINDGREVRLSDEKHKSYLVLRGVTLAREFEEGGVYEMALMRKDDKGGNEKNAESKPQAASAANPQSGGNVEP